MPDASGFRPSRQAFAYRNSWPSQPAVRVSTPVGEVDIGNAAGGLCGGMVFAARDYARAGARPPDQRPVLGEPVYDYIVRRLVDSWDWLGGPAKYLLWMNTPDADTGVRLPLVGRFVGRRGVAWLTIREEWPRVRGEIDSGEPSCLGLVTVRSADPRQLGKNHQVLAWGYEIDGPAVRLKIYDPNRGRNDGIFIDFDTGHPSRRTEFRHNVGVAAIRGFFRVEYSPATPPPAMVVR